MKKLLTISEVCKLIGLVDSKTKKPSNHVIRYWEKEFKQIKPKIINSRRYYSSKDIETIENIKFFLKELKITTAGVKKILNYNTKKLDVLSRVDYREPNKLLLKHKIYKLFLKVKSLKKYGKKDSSKSSNGSRKQS